MLRLIIFPLWTWTPYIISSCRQIKASLATLLMRMRIRWWKIDQELVMFVMIITFNDYQNQDHSQEWWCLWSSWAVLQPQQHLTNQLLCPLAPSSLPSVPLWTYSTQHEESAGSAQTLSPAHWVSDRNRTPNSCHQFLSVSMEIYVHKEVVCTRICRYSRRFMISNQWIYTIRHKFIIVPDILILISTFYVTHMSTSCHLFIYRCKILL